MNYLTLIIGCVVAIVLSLVIQSTILTFLPKAPVKTKAIVSMLSNGAISSNRDVLSSDNVGDTVYIRQYDNSLDRAVIVSINK